MNTGFESNSNDQMRRTPRTSRVALIVAASLLFSGFIHQAIYPFLDGGWHGSLSLRKPILFGISGGMTVWSLAWVFTKLKPMRFDPILINSLSIGLFIEVGLITLQFWRGVPSHFNRSTSLDALIEIVMLSLILFATGVILVLTWRSFRSVESEPAMALAIRGGMVLLALSCLLGILTSILGEVQLAKGQSYEYWGKSGVLKFPHGVALHAIQLLPVLAWLSRTLSLKNSVLVVQSALVAQVWFLFYSLWQTAQGRDRFDWDTIGGSLIGMTLLFTLYSTVSVLAGIVFPNREHSTRTQQPKNSNR